MQNLRAENEMLRKKAIKIETARDAKEKACAEAKQLKKKLDVVKMLSADLRPRRT